MDVGITSDTKDESSVGNVSGDLSGPTRKRFRTKDYDPGVAGVVVVLMCRDPRLKFKRRVRFVKKEKYLYMDIMLELEQMVPLDHVSRRRILIERICDEAPAILRKYRLKDFDEARFVEVFRSWLQGFDPSKKEWKS